MPIGKNVWGWTDLICVLDIGSARLTWIQYEQFFIVSKMAITIQIDKLISIFTVLGHIMEPNHSQISNIHLPRLRQFRSAHTHKIFRAEGLLRNTKCQRHFANRNKLIAEFTLLHIKHETIAINSYAQCGMSEYLHANQN